MPFIVGMLFRWLLLPLLILLVQALGSEFFRALRGQGMCTAWLLHPLALWFAAGIGFRVLFGFLMQMIGRHDPLEFVDTLEHELTHALVGYATLNPPVSLSATLKSGGEVELRGINILATLAPYYLPLWTLLVLALGLVVKPGMQAAWTQLLFFLLGVFCYRLLKEYRWRQTDLHLYGFAFSTFFVIILQFLLLALILHLRVLLSWRWLIEAGRHALHSLAPVWAWVQAQNGEHPAPLESVPAK